MAEDQDVTRGRWLALPLLVGLTFSLAGCQGRQQAQERRYTLDGKVVSVDTAAQQVVVDGSAIPGFMAAMTMPYAVKDPRLLGELAAGDRIRADVVVRNGSIWLENIVVLQHGNSAPASPTSRLRWPERSGPMDPKAQSSEGVSLRGGRRGSASRVPS